MRSPAQQPELEPSPDGAVRRVAVALLGRAGTPESLTYAVPHALDAAIHPGVWVSVPIGPRQTSGIVLGPAPELTKGRLRPISRALAADPAPPDLLELASWAARYYDVALGALLRTILPPAMREVRRHVRLVAGALPRPAAGEREPELGLARGPMNAKPGADSGDLERRVLDRIAPAGLAFRQLVDELGPGAVAALRRLAARGVIEVCDIDVERRRERAAVVADAAAPLPAGFARARRQAEIFAYVLARAPHPLTRAEIESRFPGTTRIVDALLQRGLLREADAAAQAAEAPSGAPAAAAFPALDLNPEQAAAASAIAAATGFSPFLLFGVTGSGKTEVYLRAAADVRRRGKSALLLVPEIGLTDQLVVQARHRFPGEIAVLHSGLRDADRARVWHDVASGRAPIVIGARSALFAPLADLGLIVVDEEHDAAYKQEEAPRYNARDLAVVRAKLASCAVVLASATPSLESYLAARDGRYRLLRLAQRANLGPMPSVETIDLRARRNPSSPPRAGAEGAARGASQPDRAPILSPALEAAIAENYRAGDQTLLFLNRRGFARFIQCESCGRVETCPHCSVSLTEHRARRAAVCHHCGYACAPAARCPECASPLAPRSFGTEQIEAAARALLPAARIARLDRDTSGSPAAVHRTLAAWRAHEIDVLVGTQMVAKGHDAPGVTLIGVVLADASLNFPDFRAAERTFQLLAQVAGRAGRGSRPGRVLIQTRQPEHASLVAACAHDFESFARSELELRQELGYPPFGRLTRVLVEGEREASEHRAEEIARRLRAAAAQAGGQIEVLGPAPAPIEKLRGRFRYQVLVKAHSARGGARLLAAAGFRSPAQRGEGRAALRTVVDVDPINML